MISNSKLRYQVTSKAAGKLMFSDFRAASYAVQHQLVITLHFNTAEEKMQLLACYFSLIMTIVDRRGSRNFRYQDLSDCFLRNLRGFPESCMIYLNAAQSGLSLSSSLKHFTTMASFVDDIINQNKDYEDLNEETASRSIVVSNIPPEVPGEQLLIHFQRKRNGGGEIDRICMIEADGNAVIIFDEADGKYRKCCSV